MKGVILAGGRGTRLGLMTKVVNKHLLPVYDRPMIMYPIATLKSMGITSIMIVTDKSRAGDFMNLLGSGREFGVHFTYGLQDNAAGIADAISISKDFAGSESITVILGDNIFIDFSTEAQSMPNYAKIFLTKVDEPERFGVVHVLDGKIVDIIEKPKEHVSNLAVTGLYQYPPDVFHLIDNLSPSERKELEVTALNKEFLKLNRLDFEIIDSYWIDAGTVESLFEAQMKIRNHTVENSSKNEVRIK